VARQQALLEEETGVVLRQPSVRADRRTRGPFAAPGFARELAEKSSELAFYRTAWLEARGGRNPADMTLEEEQHEGWPRAWRSEFDSRGSSLGQALDRVFEEAREKKLRAFQAAEATATAARRLARELRRTVPLQLALEGPAPVVVRILNPSKGVQAFPARRNAGTQWSEEDFLDTRAGRGYKL